MLDVSFKATLQQPFFKDVRLAFWTSKLQLVEVGDLYREGFLGSKHPRISLCKVLPQCRRGGQAFANR